MIHLFQLTDHDAYCISISVINLEAELFLWRPCQSINWVENMAIKLRVFFQSFKQLTESTREELISLYMDRPWLTGVMIHVGSQVTRCIIKL